MSDVKMFPIQATDRTKHLTEIPWSLIAPHEAQALRNHDQTIERLAQRQGLSACEAVAVILDRRWERMDATNADLCLRGLVMLAERLK